MNEVFAIGLMLTGSVFLLLAAVGILRLPDFFMRIQASAKASTLGTGLVLLGVAVHFGDVAVTSRAVLTIAFLMVTTPVAAHMIGRAAYLVGVPLWKGTLLDEMSGKYDYDKGVLKSHLEETDGVGLPRALEE